MSSALFALLSAQIYAGDKAPTTTGLDPLLWRGRAQVGGGITWPKAGNLQCLRVMMMMMMMAGC